MRAYFILLGNLWKPEYCSDIVEFCNAQGWRKGTFANGSVRDNVNVCFLNGDSALETTLFQRIRDLAIPSSPLLGNIAIDAESLHSVQISRYREGDHYGMHCDHDVSTKNLTRDRKLSIYVQLTGHGGLNIHDIGMVHTKPGDALIFNALTQHSAPIQKSGERHSLVAWINGDSWK